MREANPSPAADRHPARSFSLRDLLAIAFRRRHIIVLSFVGLSLGALLAIWLLPPTYEAQMKIFVQRERVDPAISAEPNVYSSDRSLSLDEMTSEVELFQSRDSLEKVVVDCGLYAPRNPHSVAAFKLRVREALGFPPDKGKQISAAVIKMEEKDLQVLPINNSDLIKITYRSESPELAAKVVKELGELYLAKHAAIHRPPGTYEFFQQQAERYKAELADAEERLVSFNREAGTVMADLEKQVALQKLSDFNIALLQTQASVAETTRRVQALQKQEGSVPPRITTQVRISDNPQLMANLKSTLLTLELKRSELLQKFSPDYRLVQEVDKEISQTLSDISDEQKRGIREETTDLDPTHQWVVTEMAKAKTDLVGLEARASAMSGAVRALQGKALSLDRQAVVQQDLLRAAKATEENYLLYHRKREEARIADALDQRKIVNAAVAEPAMVPLVPVSLPVSAQLVLAVVLAALLSAGLGFLSEHLDPSFRTPFEVEEHLGVPVLASIPKNGH